MMIQRHVFGLPWTNSKHGSEAVQLKSVQSVVERVLHECEDGVHALFRFHLASIYILEKVQDDILKFGGNAVEMLVREVDERIDKGLGVIAKVFGEQLEMRIGRSLFLLIWLLLLLLWECGWSRFG